MSRKATDKNIRDNVWRRYWGNSMDGQCWICGKHIDIGNFDCGHIISIANRGGDDILNLVPICRGCNLGMKEENILDYKKRAFSHINVLSLVQPVDVRNEIRLQLKEIFKKYLEKYIEEEKYDIFKYLDFDRKEPFKKSILANEEYLSKYFVSEMLCIRDYINITDPRFIDIFRTAAKDTVCENVRELIINDEMIKAKKLYDNLKNIGLYSQGLADVRSEFLGSSRPDVKGISWFTE